VNLQMLFLTEFFTWITHLFIWGSLVLWYLFLIIISYLPASFSHQLLLHLPGGRGAQRRLLGSLGIILLPVVGAALTSSTGRCSPSLRPRITRIVNELVMLDRDEEAAADAVAPLKAPVGFSAAAQAVGRRLAKIEKKRQRRARRRRVL